MSVEELETMKEAESIIQNQRKYLQDQNQQILIQELALENARRENKLLWIWLTILSLMILVYGVWQWII